MHLPEGASRKVHPAELESMIEETRKGDLSSLPLLHHPF